MNFLYKKIIITYFRFVRFETFLCDVDRHSSASKTNKHERSTITHKHERSTITILIVAHKRNQNKYKIIQFRNALLDVLASEFERTLSIFVVDVADKEVGLIGQRLIRLFEIGVGCDELLLVGGVFDVLLDGAQLSVEKRRSLVRNFGVGRRLGGRVLFVLLNLNMLYF